MQKHLLISMVKVKLVQDTTWSILLVPVLEAKLGSPSSLTCPWPYGTVGASDTNPDNWHVGGPGRAVTEPILGFFMCTEGRNSTSMAVKCRELRVLGKLSPGTLFKTRLNLMGDKQISDSLTSTQMVFKSPEKKNDLSSALEIPAQARYRFTTP